MGHSIANLREALEIYIGLGDREMIARSFADLTDAFIWAGRFQEAIETAHRGLAYLQADVSADCGCVFSLPSDGPTAPPETINRHKKRCQEALNIASQLSDANLDGGRAWHSLDDKLCLPAVERSRRRRFPQRTTGWIRSISLAA